MCQVHLGMVLDMFMRSFRQGHARWCWGGGKGSGLCQICHPFPKICVGRWFPNGEWQLKPMKLIKMALSQNCTWHATVESLAWCSSLFLGGLVESWAHWAQGSEDERSQHCASFAGHGGDLQVASVFLQKLWHHTVVLLLNCEVKNPQISPRCINRRIPWRKLHVVAHLSSKLFCHPSHHISSYLAYLGSVVSCTSSHVGTMREVEESPLLAPRLNKSPGSASSWVERAMVSTAASSCEAVPMTLEPGNGWEWIHPQSHSDY